MSTSVWPSDYLNELHDVQRQDADTLIVFLLSPFNPKDKYDELFLFCQNACIDIGKTIGAQVDCLRADSLSTPNVIQQDIWNYIQRSDVIIVDVSDRNGNVMLELGVASAIRDKNNVILIQSDESENFLFDVSPARHLKYRRGLFGDVVFQEQLKQALLFSLAPVPYNPRSRLPIELPLKLDLKKPRDCEFLLSPSNSHRRILDDGLEFGSFYSFKYSWATLGTEKFSNVRVQAEMKFSEWVPTTKTDGGWLGIVLRSQHFFANFGHLLYANTDGTVIYARPLDDKGSYEDYKIGDIQGFSTNYWMSFDLKFDYRSLSGSINDVRFDFPVIDMPYAYNAGLVRFQTYQRRAYVKMIQVEIPS